ncbi:MAG: DinB family protein [Candidatus Promineifilaceae bacterium]|nr:DinB family protein [Candidatus Promineifilaceae bacterium]
MNATNSAVAHGVRPFSSWIVIRYDPGNYLIAGEMFLDSLTLIRTMFAYNRSLNERLWETITTLSDAQFAQELPYSHGSIRNQMVHVTSVKGRWLRALRGQPRPRSYRLDPDDYTSPAEIRAIWRATSQAFVEYLDALTSADLERVPAGLPGPTWHVLLHVANHGTDHRAQMLQALDRMGAETFDQDLIFYLW